MTSKLKGPKGSDSLLTTALRPDVVMERGQGMYLWDTKGKKYLDFIGGWAVNALGHSPKVIVDALSKQSKILVNASPAFYNNLMLEFATELTKVSCFDRVFFGSSGAEANEGVIKLARKYGTLRKKGAYEIITTENSFHGRTLATMSASGKAKWKDLFEPKVPGFVQVPLNNIAAITQAVGPKTCAVMLEPIQGEGGVHMASPDYVRALRALCDKWDIPLIFDEIQTGFGRTGTLFCYQQYGMEPDMMTLGKGIGGGFPLSAMLVKEKYNIFEPGDQGGTYMGQPLAMAVGLAVLKDVRKPSFLKGVLAQGKFLVQELEKMQKSGHIQNVRGKGLLLAFDLKSDTAADVVAACFKKGLILNSPGPRTIRLIPPLIVGESDSKAMLRTLVQTLATSKK